MRRKLNLKKSHGFTLIELLVVVLILAILMAVALPLYLNSITNAETRTCRSNLQTIGNAVHAKYVAARGVGGYVTGTVDAAYRTANAPDLTAVPLCPAATPGTYSVAAGTGGAPFNVVCTVHGTFRYAIDSN